MYVCGFHYFCTCSTIFSPILFNIYFVGLITRIFPVGVSFWDIKFFFFCSDFPCVRILFSPQYFFEENCLDYFQLRVFSVGFFVWTSFFGLVIFYLFYYCLGGLGFFYSLDSWSGSRLLLELVFYFLLYHFIILVSLCCIYIKLEIKLYHFLFFFFFYVLPAVLVLLVDFCLITFIGSLIFCCTLFFFTFFVIYFFRLWAFPLPLGLLSVLVKNGTR